MNNNRRPILIPLTTPLFTASQGVENDDFNRRCMPMNKQQDKFEKRKEGGKRKRERERD